jgi:hypothetical protein
MKRFVMTVVLACALSASALAGEVPTGGFTPPPPPPPPGDGVTTSTTSPGEIPSVPGDVPTSGFEQQVSDGALAALLSVLGLVI